MNRKLKETFLIFDAGRPFITKVFLVFAILFSRDVFAQTDSTGFFQPSKTLDRQRVHLVAYTAAGLYPVSMYWLYTEWYKNYPQSSFHFFNDGNEWLQVDKAGHALTSYVVGKTCMRSLRWAGVDEKKSMWYGAGIGFTYQATIEVFDGFSSQWGFSVADIACNTLGSALLIGQEMAWKEQRIQLKFSWHSTDYSKYRPSQLGSDFSESIIKDYNGQTYWVSVNPKSFMKQDSKFPAWLSVTFGYGAEGMTGAAFNPGVADGKIIPSFERYRQYYLAIDFDVARIKTKSRFLSGFFKLINFIHLPAPAIEFNTGHRSEFHPFYF